MGSLSVVLVAISVGLVVALWFFKRVEPAFAKVLGWRRQRPRQSADGRPGAIEVRDLGSPLQPAPDEEEHVPSDGGNDVPAGGGERLFWALRNVNFDLVHGESLAVIGPNGAGKSTLLQVLAGILTPSEGEVSVRGQITSLLTLGAGFDQELTGRDNILLAGAFLGLDHGEMMGVWRPIVEFADIGEFIDAPIKTYSSGMRARLGFSIATSVDPDVLLLDEVLATGDQVFRAKSKARVLELVQLGEGDRARDPRHGVGHGVLQPGDAHREGQRRLQGEPPRRSSGSTRSTRQPSDPQKPS